MAFTAIKTDLGSNKCDEFFPKFPTKSPFADMDNSMMTVFRMILNDDRMEAFDYNEEHKNTAQFLVTDTSINITQKDGKLPARYYGGPYGPFNVHNSGIWMHLPSNKEMAAYMTQIKEFDKQYEEMGWVRIKDVSLYLDSADSTVVYQNVEKRGVVILGPRSKRFQLMQLAASCLPRLFPWCFEKYPLTEDEAALLKLLAEQKKDEFCARVGQAYVAYDFYGKKLSMALKGFCGQNFKNTIEHQESNIRECENRIKDYLNSVRKVQRDMEVAQLKLGALRNKMRNCTQDEQDLIEFLRENKCITLLGKKDDYIRLGVTCYLNEYNEDMFKQYIEDGDNPDSYIFSDSTFGFDITKKLFLAIWKEHRFNLRVYCEWHLLNDCTVVAADGTNMAGRTDLMEDRIPQPHIDRYQCYGGYRTVLNDLAMERDYIGVITTILSSSSSINWTDSTVVECLMGWLFGTKKNVKCLEDASGNHYTIAEAVKILQDEEKK